MEDLGGDADNAELDEEFFADVVSCLVRYSEGDLTALEGIELDLEGTPPFFRAAWDACRRIPPGETRSYRWLAAEAGSPQAMRAAGQAMARNRFSADHPLPPCHLQRRRSRWLRRRRSGRQGPPTANGAGARYGERIQPGVIARE